MVCSIASHSALPRAAALTPSNAGVPFRSEQFIQSFSERCLNIHAVELAFVLRGAQEGVAYGRRYLALDPGGRDAEGIRAAITVADAQLSGLRETRFLLDSMSTSALFGGWYALSRWPDSTETATTLLEALQRRRTLSPRDSNFLRAHMSSELAYRGRLQESFAALGMRPTKLLMELALLGAITADSLMPVIDQWMTSSNASEFAAVQWALPWFAERRDTMSLQPDVASRQRGAKLLDERLFTSLTPIEVLRAVYRGRVLQKLDRRDDATRAYQLVIAAWSNGDPQIQQYVREARDAVALARAR